MSEKSLEEDKSSTFDDLYEAPSSSGSLKRRLPPGFEEDSLLSLDEQEAALKRCPPAIPESLTRLKPLPEQQQEESKAKEDEQKEEEELPSPKVHVGCLPANLSEPALMEYFSSFGEISALALVRDYETGISKGYAFVTFEDPLAALAALKTQNHTLEPAPYMRVSPPTASKNTPETQQQKRPYHQGKEDIVLPNQKRIYIGPLYESVSNDEIRAEMVSYGSVKGITRHPRTTHHLSYATIEFGEVISLRRAFGQKVSLGKSTKSKMSCSRFIMELLLSQNVLFFHEAYLKAGQNDLERHFSQFGQVYRCMQFHDSFKDMPKSYGFVDFVDPSSVDRALEKRTSMLAPPGQFLRVTKYMPMHLLLNMCAIGDSEAQAIIRSLDAVIPDSGVWGESASKFNIQLKKDEVVSSQVRFPAKLIPKLIGERGKTIAEITRDSKCKVIVPKVQEGETNIVVLIKGLRSDIKTAQYLMQRAIKGG